MNVFMGYWDRRVRSQSFSAKSTWWFRVKGNYPGMQRKLIIEGFTLRYGRKVQANYLAGIYLIQAVPQIQIDVIF
jgi:hypothetical protein